MVLERAIRTEDVLPTLGSNLATRLPTYKRTTPEEWSREMQKAAFGPQIERVSEKEYSQLIDRVRKIRTWLEENGKTAKDHPGYKDSGLEMYWMRNEFDPDSPYVSAEINPWEQSSGRNLEHYPKFIIESTTPAIQFELNFNDTYYLSIEPEPGTIRFESSHLPRREMTRQENAIVQNSIEQTAAYFAIPL